MRLFKYIFLLIGLALTVSSDAQKKSVQQKVDSLKKIINSTKSDTLRLSCMREWDNLIYYEEPETDLKLNLQIAEQCEKKLLTILFLGIHDQ